MLIIFAVSFLGCEAQTKLPKEMPSDARMSFSSNGGMSPYFTNIEIEGEQLIFKEKMPDAIKNKIKQSNWTAKITPEDKINLYKLFVENKFDQIKNETNKSITYDAGSEGISLAYAPDKHFNVQSGANFPLSSKNKLRYRNIAGEFERLAKKYESMQEKPVETSLEDARQQAVAFFESIDTDKSGKTMYQPKFTPFFPTEWNDASQTNWISYVYASGMETSLADGERNAKPFAKIVYNPLTQKAALEKLSGKLEDGDIQGVKPLPKDALEILDTGTEVEKILLQTKSRSELSAGNANKVAAFYENWKKYNSVIYQEVTDNSGEFDRWLDENITANKVKK